MITAESEPICGVVYDTHPVEPTSSAVANMLELCPIPGIQSIQANVLAAAQNPPRRLIHQELTVAFQPSDKAVHPMTYESVRAQELEVVYRGWQGVIDIHNNATLPTTYGMIGPQSHPITLTMARSLDITNIVVLGSRDWPGYEYFNRNPNLLIVEGCDDNPDYSAEWWHARLSKLACNLGAGALSDELSPHDFRFFRRLPDISWTQARQGGFADLPWVASLGKPLPRSVASQLYDGDGEVYALSWPNGSRVGYAPPDLDYFGEAVVEIAPPHG